MALWVLAVIAGAIGSVVFGVLYVFDAVWGAQFKREVGSVPGLIQRSARGMLKIFLVSLAVLALGVVMISVCSRKPPPPADDMEISTTLVRTPDGAHTALGYRLLGAFVLIRTASAV